MSEDIRTTGSRTVYRNDWITLREDRIVRADGTPGIYSYIDKPDFALVVPAADDGFWLVEQYRYPVRRRSWEFPQGAFPAGRNGSAEDLARAELAEETGFRAGTLRRIGHLDCANGISSHAFDIWLATDLVAGEPSREAEEQDMRQQWFSRPAVERMIRSGGITDDSTVAAYALLLLEGAHPGWP